MQPFSKKWLATFSTVPGQGAKQRPVHLNAPAEEKVAEPFDAYADDEKPEKKKGLFGRIVDWFKKLFKKKKKVNGEADVQDESSESDDGLTPKQRKKAEKAAEKAEKKAAKEEKKKQKQEEKLRKQQEKARQKESESAKDEFPAEETTDKEIPVEDTSVEEASKEAAPVDEEEAVDETAAEESAAEEISPENAEEASEDERRKQTV